MSTTPISVSGSAARIRRPGASLSTRPRRERHDHDLEVAEHGREPGADVGDRLVPEDEVGGEEEARDQRQAPLPGPRGP